MTQRLLFGLEGFPILTIRNAWVFRDGIQLVVLSDIVRNEWQWMNLASLVFNNFSCLPDIEVIIEIFVPV